MTPDDFHHLLLRFSGRAPDELVSAARGWLADGLLTQVGQALAFAVLRGGGTVTEAQAVQLGELVGTELPWSGPSAEDPPPFSVAPVGPDELAEHGHLISHSLDLTLDQDGPSGPDALDRAAVSAVTAEKTVFGLWRAWRYPRIVTPFPPPKRMYLVHSGSEAVAVAARVQAAVAAAGEPHPLVEVFTGLDELPELQRLAFGCSALLWTAAPAEPIRIAPTFDTIDAHGVPGFSPERITLTDEEAEKIVAYLAGGTPLLSGTERAPDMLDPGAGDQVVPMGLRGDGRWLWSEAVTYYVDEYGVAPDPGLLSAIRAAGYVAPEADPAALHRSVSIVLAAVLEAGTAAVSEAGEHDE